MAYAVNITRRAERDLVGIFDYINAEHSDAARKWYFGLKRSILSLENHPDRHKLFAGSTTLRQLPYGRNPHIYLIIYTIRATQKRVDILHIRHGARRKPAS